MTYRGPHGGGDDDLSALGIGWDDESKVRTNVAARETAGSSAEARQDQLRLQKAWKELEQAEHTLNHLSNIPEADINPKQQREMNVLELEKIPAIVSKVQKIQKENEENKLKRLQAEKERLKKEQQLEEMRRQQKAAAAAAAASSGGGQVKVEDLASGREEDDEDKGFAGSSAGGGKASELIAPAPTTVFSLSSASRLLKRQQATRLAHLFRPEGLSHLSQQVATPSVELYRGGDLLPTSNEVTARSASSGTKKTGGKKRSRGDEDVDEEGGGDAAPIASAVDDSSELLYLQRVERALLLDERKLQESQIIGGGEGDDNDDDEVASGGGEMELVEVIQGSGLVLRNDIYTALLDYQKVGLQWLLKCHLRGEGGILGDEMGLGKTVQIAALINTLHTSGELQGPVLVVAPLTVMWQWVAELQKWAPLVRSCIYHSGSSAVRLEKSESFHSHGMSASQASRHVQNNLLAESRGKPYVIITTYAGMRNNIRELLDVGFHYVVLDEGHKISNAESEITQAAKTFITPHRIILSGSPIQNTLKELWCLFDFAKKGLLGTQARFIEEFEQPISHSRNITATRLEQATAVQCAALLRQHIQPYLLRRLKKDVNLNLPPKHERVIRCSLSDEQLRLYVEFLLSSEVQSICSEAAQNKDLQSFKDGGAGFLQDGSFVSFSSHKGGLTRNIRYRAFHILSRLRFICNHVDLFKLRVQDMDEGGTGKGLSFRSNMPVNYEGSDKLNKLRLLMREWKKNGHKVLIFSQYVMMLDVIENCVDQEDHRYIRMDGKTPGQSRQMLVDRFNRDPSIFVALLTTKVGGLGLNLTGADRVVIFDPDWNPVVDTQAKERSWRIGQRREVCIYRMVVSGTVEEHILHRQLAKTYVSEKVLKDPTLQRSFTSNSLVETFFLSPDVYAKRLIPRIRRQVCASNTIDDEVRDTDFDEDQGDPDAEDNRPVVLHPDNHLGGMLGGTSAAAVAHRGGGGAAVQSSSSSYPHSHHHRDADGGMVLMGDRSQAIRDEISAVMKEEKEEEEVQHRAARMVVKREGSVASTAASGGSGGRRPPVTVKKEEEVEEDSSNNETSVISSMIDTRDAPATRLPSSREGLFEHALASASASRTFARVLDSSSSLRAATSSSSSGGFRKLN